MLHSLIHFDPEIHESHLKYVWHCQKFQVKIKYPDLRWRPMSVGQVIERKSVDSYSTFLDLAASEVFLTANHRLNFALKCSYEMPNSQQLIAKSSIFLIGENSHQQDKNRRGFDSSSCLLPVLFLAAEQILSLQCSLATAVIFIYILGHDLFCWFLIH